MSVFLIRYVLKAWGSRPWAPKRIYEYIPYQICFKILQKQTRGSKGEQVLKIHSDTCATHSAECRQHRAWMFSMCFMLFRRLYTLMPYRYDWKSVAQDKPMAYIYIYIYITYMCILLTIIYDIYIYIHNLQCGI